MHVQNFNPAGSGQITNAQEPAWMLKDMIEDKSAIGVEIILHEASTVLQAALRHAKELSEAGVTDNDLHLMRMLITHVAVHSYTSLENKTNVNVELHELKILKDVIFRTAEMRFGHTSNVLNEFKDTARH